MNGIYYFKTIKECEKQIVDKTMIFDTTCASNINLFKCILHSIESILLFMTIIHSIIAGLFFDKGFKYILTVFALYLIIYCILAIIISVTENEYDKIYFKIKSTLVDNILDSCEEFKETEYSEHERKLIIARCANLAGLNIDWDKVNNNNK